MKGSLISYEVMVKDIGKYLEDSFKIQRKVVSMSRLNESGSKHTRIASANLNTSLMP